MSSLTPTPNALPQLEAKPQPAADAQRLRDQLKALLDQPDLLPDKFLAYMVDYQTVNQPQISVSNIAGFDYNSGTAAPTTGTWVRGQIVYNTAPSPSGFIGWVCTATGTPGTWKTFGAISA